MSAKTTLTALTVLSCTLAPSGTGRSAPSIGTAVGADTARAAFYTLVGTVLDSTSGKPVNGAQVLLREDPTSQPYFAYTDRTGGFVISPIRPGSYQLLVRRIGSMPYVEERVARAGLVDTLRVRLAQSQFYHYTFPVEAVAPTSKRSRTIPCRRPILATSAWNEWKVPRSGIALRMPRWAKRDADYEARVENVRAAARDTGLTSTLLAANQVGVPRAYLTINVVDSVTLAYGADKLPEESECREQIGNAQATVFSFNQKVEVGDMAYVGPYIVMAQLRFPDGLSLELFGDAEKREQQDEILAAIRTIRRVPRAP